MIQKVLLIIEALDSITRLINSIYTINVPILISILAFLVSVISTWINSRSNLIAANKAYAEIIAKEKIRELNKTLEIYNDILNLLSSKIEGCFYEEIYTPVTECIEKIGEYHRELLLLVDPNRKNDFIENIPEALDKFLAAHAEQDEKNYRELYLFIDSMIMDAIVYKAIFMEEIKAESNPDRKKYIDKDTIEKEALSNLTQSSLILKRLEEFELDCKKLDECSDKSFKI